MKESVSIISIPKIAAVYFALLQCGYDYYAAEKDADLVTAIEKYRYLPQESVCSFFTEARQSTCEVYHYWPRASILESATFYLDIAKGQFTQYDAFCRKVMSAGNILDSQRDDSLWRWIKEFPSVLKEVYTNKDYLAYMSWEQEWIRQQNEKYKDELLNVYRIICTFLQSHFSPVREISVVLNPIKCAYSADYHLIGNHLFFTLGEFQQEFVVHEFLHHIAHPLVLKHREEILKHHRKFPGIDSSYYLLDDDRGRLNAFEEYFVHKLTALCFSKGPQVDIENYLQYIIWE